MLWGLKGRTGERYSANHTPDAADREMSLLTLAFEVSIAPQSAERFLSKKAAGLVGPAAG
jgi:hypothetical protein